jgi:hypothetical protein
MWCRDKSCLKKTGWHHWHVIIYKMRKNFIVLIFFHFLFLFEIEAYASPLHPGKPPCAYAPPSSKCCARFCLYVPNFSLPKSFKVPHHSPRSPMQGCLCLCPSSMSVTSKCLINKDDVHPIWVNNVLTCDMVKPKLLCLRNCHEGYHSTTTMKSSCFKSWRIDPRRARTDPRRKRTNQRGRARVGKERGTCTDRGSAHR